MTNRRGPKLEHTLGGPVRARTLSMDDETFGWLKWVGDGNASRGLRLAAKTAYLLKQRDALPAEVAGPRHPALHRKPG